MKLIILLSVFGISISNAETLKKMPGQSISRHDVSNYWVTDDMDSGEYCVEDVRHHAFERQTRYGGDGWIREAGGYSCEVSLVVKEVTTGKEYVLKMAETQDKDFYQASTSKGCLAAYVAPTPITCIPSLIVQGVFDLVSWPVRAGLNSNIADSVINECASYAEKFRYKWDQCK